MSHSGDLTIRSESVQRLYDLYLADRFSVNRRYQRKLVWSVEEKERLIDSMLRDLPLPLVLVAERSEAQHASYELIDGLQRMNAIFAFLENEFSVNGTYFNLDTLADTKQGKDRGDLNQQSPVLSRDASIKIANYAIALSVFRSSEPEAVDEAFRRINSGGRRLSRHALRQAGTLSLLADVVRDIASRIRNDTSPGDIVPLRTMPRLSISNANLGYGVNVDEIFWVQNSVLRREDVRESLDEQLILDIVVDMLVEPLESTGTRNRDKYYNYVDNLKNGSTPEAIKITHLIETHGPSVVVEMFLAIFDEWRTVLQHADQPFSRVLGVSSGGRSPRYYHAAFMAFYELMYKQDLRIRDHRRLAQLLVSADSPIISIKSGGGDWTDENKRRAIDTLKGVIRDHFEGPVNANDLAVVGYASMLENILSNALVEQQLFECKQGLLNLGEGRRRNDRLFDRILQTLAAMHNMGPRATGYIILGVADKPSDLERIVELDRVEPFRFRGFDVVGLEREAAALGWSMNDYWHWILQKISDSSLASAVSQQVTADARLVPYQGLSVGVLKVVGARTPAFFNNRLYHRLGSETRELNQEEFMLVYERFAGED